MAGLTYVAPTDDIILQEGVFAYNYQASGAIMAGQVVTIQDSMKVGVFGGALSTAGASAKNVVGIAAYGCADKGYVAVFGPGNVVRCVTSGAVSCGDLLTLGSVNGHVGSQAYLTNITTTAAGTIIGKALESKASATVVKVLLI